ncbi:C2H2-type zinc finger protein [Candidatus Borrarchaeum sp.]|uniref:C2H2-type zinc finger protein n=1 Tax=Candidatus Borrarchaeum sp. TaxID=2846742 RepID=UPI00258022BA|nr:C2H2-type zinc finger protein [Candidatus Borrarchaeum sp.]
MVQIKFDSAKLWSSLVKGVNALIKEAEFETTKEGLHLRAIDDAHIAMIDLDIPSDSMKEYSFTLHDKEADFAKFGINITEMATIMRRIPIGEKLTLTLDSQKSKFHVVADSLYTKRRFSIPLLGSTSAEDIPVPKIDFTTKIKLKAKYLKEAIKDAAVMGDYLKLKTTADKFSLWAEGDTGNVSIDYEYGESISLEKRGDAVGIYALKYLDDMTDPIPGESEVSIEFSNDMPLKLTWMLNGSKLDYYLAPRIPPSDEEPPKKEEKEQEKTKDDTEEEKETHEETKEFPCDECGKTFTSQRGLNTHMRVHKDSDE